MRILNMGSLNIDRVYGVDHFAVGGETIAAYNFDVFCGGKGLNQSIALARAGAQVFHAGAIGPDGDLLLKTLERAGVDVSLILRDTEVSGHAILQIDPNGQNCIIVYPGANGRLFEGYIDKIMEQFGQGDLLVLQNEVSNVPYAIKQAKKRGMSIAFNPSPITAEITTYPVELVDYLIVNEIEGKALAGGADAESILTVMHAAYPEAAILLTLGEEGAVFLDPDGKRTYEKAAPCEVVDTTAAGDTYTGYFLAAITKHSDVAEAMHLAATASAIAVSRKGAEQSIPTIEDVRSILNR